MSTREVAKASGRDVRQFAAPWTPAFRKVVAQDQDTKEEGGGPTPGVHPNEAEFTHWVGDESDRTSVLLAFRDGRLVALQVGWLEPWMLMGIPEAAPTRLLCPSKK